MLRRSNVAVSPGPTVSEPGRSSGWGSRATTPMGTESTVHSCVPATRTGTWHASVHGEPVPASYCTTDP